MAGPSRYTSKTSSRPKEKKINTQKEDNFVDRFAKNKAAESREKAAQTDTRFGGNIEKSNTGGGTPYDSSKDFISKSQDRETYYNPGGQGTTNENITNRAFENFNEEAQKEALAEKIAANTTVAEKLKKLNIFSGKEITQLNDLQLAAAKKMLGQYSQINPGLLKSFILSRGQPIAGLFGKDQSFSDMDGNIIDPDTISEGPNGIFGMNEDGKMVEVRRTKEGTIDQMKETFGDDVLKSLQKFSPEEYYPFMGMPGTTGGLETLGKKAAFKKNQDGKYITADGRIVPKEQAEKYNQMIFNARELGRDRDGGGQSGIMTAAPVVPPVVPDPIIPVDPIPAPGTTTPIPTPRYPGSVVNDYTNMGIPNIYGNQQIPTYGYANYNQTGQPVGLQSYLDNLRKRFGIG